MENITIILLIIIVLLIVKRLLPASFFVDLDPYSEHFLYNGSKWFKYRIGDLYYRPYLVDKESHSERFRYSIANDLIGNKDIKSVIDKRLLKSSDFLLHLRIGDVIVKCLDFHKKEYFKDQEWWDSLIEYLKKNKIKRVVMMAGSHMPEFLDKSWTYIESKKNFFEEAGFETQYRLGCAPDEDLIYSVNAKHFTSTGGNFGRLLSEVVSNYGGKVFKSDLEFEKE